MTKGGALKPPGWQCREPPSAWPYGSHLWPWHGSRLPCCHCPSGGYILSPLKTFPLVLDFHVGAQQEKVSKSEFLVPTSLAAGSLRCGRPVGDRQSPQERGSVLLPRPWACVP